MWRPPSLCVFPYLSGLILFLTVWIERTAVGSSVQALLHALRQLRLEGEIAGRALTRMAEVLEGRHTDEEIAQADASVIRDLTEERPEATKRRLSQVYSPRFAFVVSSLFVMFSVFRRSSFSNGLDSYAEPWICNCSRQVL